MEERQFTVEEANAMLATLRPALERIRQARQVVLAGGERIKQTAGLNGGGGYGKEYWEVLQTLRRDVESLSEQGIVLRDPESGLIDFPARRDGQDIFLCWRVGEDRVGYWHGPETGFAGRKPLP